MVLPWIMILFTQIIFTYLSVCLTCFASTTVMLSLANPERLTFDTDAQQLSNAEWMKDFKEIKVIYDTLVKLF